MKDGQISSADPLHALLDEQLRLDIPATDFGPDSRREYLHSHPWLTFNLDLRQAPTKLWILLGEAKSKCEALGRIPIPPWVADDLHRIYLVKGVGGSTGIEGNTLTEEQILQILSRDLELPPSQTYMQREVENIIHACDAITNRALTKRDPRLSDRLVLAFNKMVLNGLDLKDEVTPGKVRTYSVGVMRYLGAPHQDCPLLLHRLCLWLNDLRAQAQTLCEEIIRAIVAHLYLAWIHPFGDGNGRTARLIEFHILVNAGVPTPAAHLLSNHYNLTRKKYLDTLDQASRNGGNVVPFVLYALEGFVEQLREQVAVVGGHQVGLAWKDFVNERFADATSAADIRRRDLLQALSWRPVKKSEIRTLNSRIEQEYRDKTDKAITRDLNWLLEEKLITETEDGMYSARTEIIFGFLPDKVGCELKQETEDARRLTQNLLKRMEQKRKAAGQD